MITKQQQRLIAKYGTYDEAEIIRQKSNETQKKFVPGETKSNPVNLNAEQCKNLCTQAGMEYLEGYENRVIEYTLSDETIDRDGDIIVQDGLELDNYKKNPVVLLFHNSYSFPIGNYIKLFRDPIAKSTKGWLLFADDRVDTSGMAERAFRFAKSRIMRASSIGFQGLEVKFPTTEERKILGMRDYGVIFLRSELMEHSLCPVPSNPHALSDALKAGKLKATDLEFIEISNDEDIPMTKEELDQKLKAEMGPIREELEQLRTKSGRRISGANMGRLKTMYDKHMGMCIELKEFIDEHDLPEEEETEEEKQAKAEALKAEQDAALKAAENQELEGLAAEIKALTEDLKK